MTHTEPTTPEDYKFVAALVGEHGPANILELVAQVCEDEAAATDEDDEIDLLEDAAFNIRETISRIESGE